MELTETVANTLDDQHQLQSRDQTSFWSVDRFIRLKTTYWNRRFAVVLLTCIGVTIQQLQWQSLYYKSSNEFQETYDFGNFKYGMCIGYIPGGILATVYPAHKIFGISFIASSICHFLKIVDKSFYLNAHLHNLSSFCIGTTMAIALSATHRICTFWIPLKKQSIRYSPIILWMITMFYLKLYMKDIAIYLREQSEFIGMVGLAWFVLWSYVIIGDRSQRPNLLFKSSNTATRYSGISDNSSRQSTISDIPWKSFCTSMPVIAIVLSYMCYGIVCKSTYFLYDHFFEGKLENTLRTNTTIFLLLVFVLVELNPEIIGCFSVTNIRKICSCTFLVTMSIVWSLEAFKVKTFFFLETKTLNSFIFFEIEFFLIFGFNVNHLDIAPKYASILYGFQLTVYHIVPWLRSYTDLYTFYSYEVLNVYVGIVVMAVIYLAVAKFYAKFASAEIQPWAKDKPVEENQRNNLQDVNLPAVTDL